MISVYFKIWPVCMDHANQIFARIHFPKVGHF